MSARGWHHELGFSSIGAYAVERTGRKARWATESAALARMLEVLPALRTALEAGTLGWSMVEVVARRATPETELGLVTEARGATVRQMRQRLSASSVTAASEEDECVLSFAVDTNDAWALDCTRWLFDRMEPGATADDFVHALVAEGLSTLVELVPAGEMEEMRSRAANVTERLAAWRAQRRAWTDEAEARSEGRLDLANVDGERPQPVWPLPIEAYTDALGLDAHVREVAAALAEQDVALGSLAEQFWRSDGWRLLGYGSEKQYARERLGMSLSAIKMKRRLARQTRALPAIATALERHEIGFEAALMIARIATSTTVEAWIARARRRTVKLLREEISAAELAVRLGAKRDQGPPSDEAIAAIARGRLETGKLLASATQGKHEFPADAPGEFARRARALLSQISGTELPVPFPHRGFSRMTMRYVVSEDTRDLFRAFEYCFTRARPFLPSSSLARFLCASFYLVWSHLLDPDVAYAHIYARDGFVCKSPTCHRRDVTPHHLKFRSAGGGDDDENVASLCVFCHLQGVHEGRIRALPPASNIRWELGTTPIIVVEGREKLPLVRERPVSAWT